MEAWSFIHKETKKIIRVSKSSVGDIEFGCEFYFSESKWDPIWMTEFYEDIEFLLRNKNIHPEYSVNYRKPDKSIINLDNYDVVKLDITLNTI
jgi:hypothetical protein